MKLLDFGPITGRLMHMTLWHMLSYFINSCCLAFTMVFILNYMLKHIGPEIQAIGELSETILVFIVLVIIGKVSRQQRWLKSTYLWIFLGGIIHSSVLFLLVCSPETVCIVFGINVSVYAMMHRLTSYGRNLVFRGESKTAHENVCEIMATAGAIGGSIIAILNKDLGIWPVIYLEATITMCVWVPSEIVGTKLVLDEIDRQGGAQLLADKINQDIVS